MGAVEMEEALAGMLRSALASRVRRHRGFEFESAKRHTSTSKGLSSFRRAGKGDNELACFFCQLGERKGKEKGVGILLLGRACTLPRSMHQSIQSINLNQSINLHLSIT